MFEPCKLTTVDELQSVRALLTRELPSDTSAVAIMDAQTDFGLWALLQASKGQDKAFEADTVTAAIRIFDEAQA